MKGAHSDTSLAPHRAVELTTILRTGELDRRAERPPDLATENRALVALAEALAGSPHRMLETLADTMIDVFRCGSAGVTLLTPGHQWFCWSAVAGAWREHLGLTTSRKSGPWGDVIAANASLLFSRWDRRYPELANVTPIAEESLVTPVHVHARAVGTIWIVAHDPARQFDSEDRRLLESLSRFAGAAVRASESVDSREQRRAALNVMEDAIEARDAVEHLNLELAAREQRFREMIDALPAAVYVTDADGRLTHFNPECIRLAGRTPQPGADQWCVTWKLYQSDGTPLPLQDCPMAMSLDSGRPIRGQEVVAERPDGTRVWLAAYPTPLTDADGRIVGGINMLVDITERKRAEEAAQRSEVQLQQELADTKLLQSISAELIDPDDFKSLYDKIMDAAISIMRSNMASMQVVDEREDALRLLGSRGFDGPFSEIFELNCADARTCCAVARRLGRRVIVPDIETCEFLVGTPALGDLRRMGIRAVQSTPLFSRGGRMVGMISTHWRVPHTPSEHDLRLLDVLARQAADLLDRKHADEELRAQAAALSELHRRKDEFLAMLSHELRNPLAPIANAVHLLRLQPTSDNKTDQQARAIIERQVGLLKHLIDDLLEVSRITTGRLQLRQERVALAGIVEGAVETVRGLIDQRRHRLSVSVPPEPIWVHADAARLEQVIVNLLTNAAKYTNAGGEIWLSIAEEAGRAVLRVRDTGVGIAPEFLPRIFDLFAQAERGSDRSEGGLGIGLSLVQRLVLLHAGTVEASSELGRGTEFIVRLPLAATTPAVNAPSTNRNASSGGSCRVLVVDDNVDAANALELLLTSSGHDVRSVHDGPTALEAVLDYRPDVVLLDIGLPGLDGFEVASRIRRFSAVARRPSRRVDGVWAGRRSAAVA